MMRSFTHIETDGIAETCMMLGEYDGTARLIAGGTDLLLSLKDDILPDYPKAIIDIKAIPGLDTIDERDETLKIGALMTLSEIAVSPKLVGPNKILAEAANAVATPQIRNTATIGGNLCQDVRCCYYRYPRHIGGPITCLRKGKGPCYAIKGDNRYHALWDGKKCFAVCPSDTAVALAALDAMIVTTSGSEERKVAATAFYGPLGNVLKPDEIVTHVELPKKKGAIRQVFKKFTIRKPIDFAVVSIALVLQMEDGRCADARIVLGAVAPGPKRALDAESFLIGKAMDRETAQAAAQLAVSGAKPLGKNAYKIEIVKSLVEDAIVSCA